MKNTFFGALLLALLSSCNNDLKELDIPKECFPPASFFNYTGDQADIDAFLESWPSLFYGNCITPNGDGINDEFDLIAISGQMEFETKNFKFYTKKKKLITERDDSKWDGKLSDGTIENCIYGFSVDFVLANGNTITGYGSFCVRKCFYSDDDLNALVFGDQFHRRLGVIYPTQEEAVYCDEN
jgi:gliding motility-associated-like protein